MTLKYSYYVLIPKHKALNFKGGIMKRTLLRPSKDFSEIMESLDLDNIKPNPTISEMTQTELQDTMDYLMQYEVPCLLELINNAENEKELKFYKEKMIFTQKRYADLQIQHLKNFCNM